MEEAFAEQIIPGTFIRVLSEGLIAPKGVPEPIMEKLYSAVDAVMKMPDMRDRLIGLGLAPMDLPRARLSGFLQAEEAKWSELVQVSGAAASVR